MEEISIVPLILCGGTGSRLWPLSRKSFPKQYIALDNEDKTLLQRTYERISYLNNIQPPILVCNEDHRFIVAEQMKQINVKPRAIILEPSARNTAPAITVGVLKALQNYKNPFILVLSSDHFIKEEKKFVDVIEAGLEDAKKNKLVTFGIVPTSPETGYGYIESEKELDNSDISSSTIKRFIEKPNLLKAKEFIKSRKFTWNSGIFLFKASILIQEIQKFSPIILESCTESLKGKAYDLDFERLEKKSFEQSPNISIDNAVMEKSNLGVVLPLNAGWQDIGSWDGLWHVSKKDKNGNFLKGSVLLNETSNCYVRSENRLVVGIGLQNLSIVETSDAILITDMNKSQNVKEVVQKLKKEGFKECQEHRKMLRPWGYYESVEEDARWKVKLIYVKPGEKLSLQMHHHRSEHWVVVNGTAFVEIGDMSKNIFENQSIYIPLGSKHRLSNPGKIPLKLIEVQSGSYLGEDDIERYKDNYGRVDQK